MLKRSWVRWSLLIAANVLVVCVLSFYGTSGAAQSSGRQPFGNSVQQRQTMIRELGEIKALLKEQNALLRGQAANANVKPSNPR